MTKRKISFYPDEICNSIYIPYLNNTSRVQIFYGGSGSGKSVFVAQRLILDLLHGGRNYLVCRAIGKDNRRSTFVEIKKIIDGWGLHGLFTVNKTDMTITCENGYQVMFTGLDDLQKLKSITPEKGVLTDIWAEEATQLEPTDLKELMKRQRGGDDNVPKRLTLTFNPIFRTHHIYLNYFANIGWTDKQTTYTTPELSILKTWYIHNRFLTRADISDLENETDEYYKSVYTWGSWGVLGNVIFKNWRVEDLSSMRDQFTNHRNGLDFGFSDDPAALTVSHYDKARKTIYIYDELYERGLTNDLLASEILARIDKQYVRCDSAEPKSIAELRGYGVNALAAKKGKDSVNFGIQWLQQQQIVLDPSCINTRTELEIYHWKQDSVGNPIKQPVDKQNHAVDSLRYSYEDDMTATGWARGAKK